MRPTNGRGSNQYVQRGRSSADQARSGTQSGMVAALSDYGSDVTDSPQEPTASPMSRAEEARERVAAAVAKYGNSAWAQQLENPTFGPDAGAYPLPTAASGAPSYTSAPTGGLASASFALDDSRDACRDAIDAAEMSPTPENLAALDARITALTAAHSQLHAEHSRTPGSCRSATERLDHSRRTLARANRVARQLRWESENLVPA